MRLYQVRKQVHFINSDAGHLNIPVWYRPRQQRLAQNLSGDQLSNFVLRPPIILLHIVLRVLYVPSLDGRV